MPSGFVAAMLELEPTRSVLHRSAATMAMELGETTAAEKLLHRALAGSPPAGIDEDLRDLLEQVTFKRHLELRGIQLHDDEVQMAIAGNAVGLGIAPTEEFLSRVSRGPTGIKSCNTSGRSGTITRTQARFRGPIPDSEH